MQAMLGTALGERLAGSAELCSGSLETASMPPAARKLRIQVARAECTARSPRLARKTCGRLAGAGSERVGRIAQPLERLGQTLRR